MLSGSHQSSNRNTDDGSFGHHAVERLEDALSKLENEKVNALSDEVAYLRQLIEFQNNKIERLTTIITDYFGNKNQESILNSLSNVQDNVLDHDHDQVNEVQEQVRNQVDQQVLSSHQDIGQSALDGNMDPQLQQVAAAAAAVQAHEQAQQQAHVEHQEKTKKQHKRKHDITSDQAGNNSDISRSSSKRPNIVVDFLQNPASVKEIYEEFTKGFRGQPPLKDMDVKYGKHEWRGDSRSKESKRFQRRKKLCDAIDRGSIKYGKQSDEIISYIEEFRGEKSLTWVMNGNLPSDLLS
ncbi:transcriptional activator of glycolytic enzymes-domain-containing protein [Scheffersomyces coipomensis]|uniref:transcriptional activator of glycolytic enzymes-domain-containing protein n=1 Tax=Scheffersomyces coipomensis TaxID=1788519 RepID=UPI00315D8E94